MHINGMEKLRKAGVSHFAKRLAVFTAAGLLLVEGCACTKQYKGANSTNGNMGDAELVRATPRQAKSDSLKTVPKKLTPEEKMKSRLDEISKEIRRMEDEEYARSKMRPSERPAFDYKKAMSNLIFLTEEEGLYTAALKKDNAAIAKAKTRIMDWGEKSEDTVRAIKILDDFEINRK